jgi:hypothetical protein|uniref:hypothetical protein n=1 Tax=Candidatus Planktophila sp. TaxID=2175601 RepID=UPI00404B5811
MLFAPPMISRTPSVTTSLSLRSPRVIVACTLFLAALLSSFAFAALSDQSSQYWVARNSITPGSLVTSEDIVLFDASLIENAELYFEESNSPIGMISTQLIGAGQFLSVSVLTQESARFDTEQVPLNILPSDIPAVIEVGEPISLYWVPDAVNSQSLSAPKLLLTGIFLESIDRKGSNFGSGLAITVSVDSSQVAKILSGTSHGRLVVVIAHG